jgi:uncharacterized protein YodC (DUF2158 family)
MSLGQKKSAMRMRDIIRTLVDSQIAKLVPQLGTVASIDRINKSATVILNGDTAEISVKMFRIQPLQVGDVVQVSGGPGKYTISDVLQGYGWNASRWFERLQTSMSGGGTVGFATNNFTWTVRFMLYGAGDGLQTKTNLAMFFIGPCVGAIPVPRYNSSNNAVAATVANGVTMAQPYDVLYYELPLDNDDPGAFDETRFRLVGQDGSGPFDVPEHWIMVAARNSDSTSGELLKIMNGKIITS